MKRIVYIFLTLSIGSVAPAGNGRTLKRGSIEIQLNAEPVASLMSRGKTNELEEKLTDGRRMKTPELNLTEEQYDFLAGNLIGTRSIPMEQAEALKKRNPDFQYTDYTSSTYLKHWPVEEIERDYMMHLAMCPAAILQASISPEATEFSVTPYVFPENEITKWYLGEVQPKEEYLKRADGTRRTPNDLIPIYPSVVKAGWSKSAREFLFFIRIGNELMRVDEWDAATGRLKVLRGFNGSNAARHHRGDVVTSPIYNGNGPLAKNAISFGAKQTMRLESALAGDEGGLGCLDAYYSIGSIGCYCGFIAKSITACS